MTIKFTFDINPNGKNTILTIARPTISGSYFSPTQEIIGRISFTLEELKEAVNVFNNAYETASVRQSKYDEEEIKKNRVTAAQIKLEIQKLKEKLVSLNV